MEYLAKGERRKAFLPALCVAAVASFAIKYHLTSWYCRCHFGFLGEMLLSS